jgi:hypothetical protein
MATEIVIPYLKARDQLPTFTVINCVSWKLPYKWIGHTAIVFVDPVTGQVMIFESTTLNKHTGISGVQMMAFGAWLAHYPGKVYARVPKFGDSSDGANATREIMAAEFIKEHLGSSYPDIKTMTGRFKLYMASLDFRLFGRDWFTYTGKDEGIFCTQLVIMMLQACGLFGTGYKASEYEPDDTRGNNHWFDDSVIDMVYLPEVELK